MTEQAPTLCVHHHPCSDGFTAAWAVWKRFGNSVKFHPGVHGQPPPDVTGEHVVIVDFSYPKDVLFEMCKTAASILILDHHLTAQKDLADFPPPCGTWEAHVEEAASYRHGCTLDRIGVQFDMNRSGAMMAWNYFHSTSGTPARAACAGPGLVEVPSDRHARNPVLGVQLPLRLRGMG